MTDSDSKLKLNLLWDYLLMMQHSKEWEKIDDIKNDLQKDVLKLHKRAESWGVTISQDKTVSIMFVKSARTTIHMSNV